MDFLWMEAIGVILEGRHFLGQQGDPRICCEEQLSGFGREIIPLGESASSSSVSRRAASGSFFTEDAITYQNRRHLQIGSTSSTSCSIGIGTPVMDGCSRSVPERQLSGRRAVDQNERHFTAKVDALTYVHTINYSGLRTDRRRPVLIPPSPVDAPGSRCFLL